MNDLSRILIITGVVIILIGIFLNFCGKVPLIGRLPGDILIKKDNFTFYFPLATSIIISIILTIILIFPII